MVGTWANFIWIRKDRLPLYFLLLKYSPNTGVLLCVSCLWLFVWLSVSSSLSSSLDKCYSDTPSHFSNLPGASQEGERKQRLEECRDLSINNNCHLLCYGLSWSGLGTQPGWPQSPKHCAACFRAHLNFSYPGRASLDEKTESQGQAHWVKELGMKFRIEYLSTGHCIFFIGGFL